MSLKGLSSCNSMSWSCTVPIVSSGHSSGINGHNIWLLFKCTERKSDIIYTIIYTSYQGQIKLSILVTCKEELPGRIFSGVYKWR